MVWCKGVSFSAADFLCLLCVWCVTAITFHWPEVATYFRTLPERTPVLVAFRSVQRRLTRALPNEHGGPDGRMGHADGTGKRH